MRHLKAYKVFWRDDHGPRERNTWLRWQAKAFGMERNFLLKVQAWVVGHWGVIIVNQAKPLQFQYVTHTKSWLYCFVCSSSQVRIVRPWTRRMFWKHQSDVRRIYILIEHDDSLDVDEVLMWIIPHSNTLVTTFYKFPIRDNITNGGEWNMRRMHRKFRCSKDGT